MVSIELRYLKSHAVDGQITFWGRGEGAIKWSADNQVVIVHKKGVNIYECCQTPGIQKVSPVLTVVPSYIDGPGRVFAPNTGNVMVHDIMTSTKKQIIFELMRDPILRPRSYDATLFLNYYIKGEWSTVPVYRGLNNECRCILGLLTNSHQLLIYGRTNRRYSSEKGWTEPWELLIDITNVYNRFLVKSWNNSPTDTLSQFDRYKNRLYELAIIDFIWIPDWDLSLDYRFNDQTKGVFRTMLMTFHANGDVCIWRITAAQVVKPKYFSRVLHKTNLIKDDTFSTVGYSLVSSTIGLLVIGTNKGSLRAYRVEKRNKVKDDLEEEGSEPFQKYIIHNDGVNLWEEDMLRIESIFIKPESSDRTKVTVVAVKHPNILIASNLTVLYHKVLAEECSILKVPNGPIVGLSENADGLLVTSHEAGIMSLISWNKGVLKYIPESRLLIFDPKKVKRRKFIDYGTVQNLERPKRKAIKEKEKRIIFQGLGTSRNKSMICIARTVGMYYDHLKIRRPSHIVFYSLLPQNMTWSYVLKLYAENNYSLRASSDVLAPFRVALREKTSNAIYDDIIKWAVPLRDKSTEELRLLCWCLKIRPGPPSLEWDVARAERLFSTKYMRRLAAIEALNKYRTEVVIDRIMERRCASLVKAVSDHQEEPTFSFNIEINKQCLKAMYEFLESKDEPVSIPPKPEFDPLPHIPICHWCKGPLEFPLEKFDYRYQCEEVIEEFRTEFETERITGFKWKSRRHPVKDFGIHVPEICILSLLPVQFPYRKCPHCSVLCLMEPAFGQQPYCPLCDSFMYPAQMPLDIPEGVEEEGFDEDGEEELVMETPDPNFTLPQLERAEPFIPGFFVKHEPVDIVDSEGHIVEEGQAMDLRTLPHLTNEGQGRSISIVDPLDAWAAESVSSSEYDSDSGSESIRDDDNSSSSDESGNETDTSTSSNDGQSSESESTDHDSSSESGNRDASEGESISGKESE